MPLAGLSHFREERAMERVQQQRASVSAKVESLDKAAGGERGGAGAVLWVIAMTTIFFAMAGGFTN
jgi:hypothetical protein